LSAESTGSRAKRPWILVRIVSSASSKAEARVGCVLIGAKHGASGGLCYGLCRDAWNAALEEHRDAVFEKAMNAQATQSGRDDEAEPTAGKMLFTKHTISITTAARLCASAAECWLAVGQGRVSCMPK
jgi:hypothetical protein